MTNLPHGVVTFLFTDLQGSTRLFQRLGDAYLPVLDRHNQLIRQALDRHRGYEVKTEGDAFFASFEDPADALTACLDAQLALLEEPWPEGVDVQVRMGLHRGEVHVVDDDYVGMSVHEAARIGAAGHGGQVLCSDEVRDAIGNRLPDGAQLRDLGEHGLKDIAGPRTIWQLAHPGLAPSFPPLRTLTARSHNLPTPAHPLIGRGDVLERIVRLLLDPAKRLVAVTGEGGIGKSRLALETGWSLLSWFPAGVWWVQLATATTGPEALAAVVAAVGGDATASDQVAATAAALGGDRALLVLDNTEQLGDEVVVVADLLDRVLGASVLATSRVRLRLRAEHRVVVDPLDDAGAARLLIDRATAALGDEPDIDDATMAELLSLLGGMPLAIELAAARLDGVEAPALARALRTSIALLDEGARDLPPRHRALRSTIAWSLDLASPAAREAYVALGAFAGGAQQADLATVLGWDEDATAHALAELTGAALARQADEDDERVWQLEPLRQHGAELLAADPVAQATTFALHGEAMAALAARSAPLLLGGDQARAAANLDTDDANLAIALDRATPEVALQIATDAMRGWILRGRWTEARARLVAVHDRAAADGDPALRAQALLGAGYLAHRQGDLAEAERLLAAAAMAIAPRAGGAAQHDSGDGGEASADLALAANIANQQAEVERLAGRSDTAEAGYARALEMADAAGDRRIAASILMSRAALATEQRNHGEAAASWQRAHAEFELLGDRASALQCAASLARLSGSAIGDFAEMERWAKTALDGARELGAVRVEAEAEEILGQLPRSGTQADQRVAVAGHLARSAELYQQLGNEDAAYRVRVNLAFTLLGRGDPEGGRAAFVSLASDAATPETVLREALQAFQRFRIQPDADAPGVQVAIDAALDAVQARLRC